MPTRACQRAAAVPITPSFTDAAISAACVPRTPRHAGRAPSPHGALSAPPRSRRCPIPAAAAPCSTAASAGGTSPPWPPTWPSKPMPGAASPSSRRTPALGWAARRCSASPAATAAGGAGTRPFRAARPGARPARLAAPAGWRQRLPQPLASPRCTTAPAASSACAACGRDIDRDGGGRDRRPRRCAAAEALAKPGGRVRREVLAPRMLTATLECAAGRARLRRRRGAGMARRGGRRRAPPAWRRIRRRCWPRPRPCPGDRRPGLPRRRWAANAWPCCRSSRIGAHAAGAAGLARAPGSAASTRMTATCWRRRPTCLFVVLGQPGAAAAAGTPGADRCADRPAEPPRLPRRPRPPAATARRRTRSGPAGRKARCCSSTSTISSRSTTGWAMRPAMPRWSRSPACCATLVRPTDWRPGSAATNSRSGSRTRMPRAAAIAPPRSAPPPPGSTTRLGDGTPPLTFSIGGAIRQPGMARNAGSAAGPRRCRHVRRQARRAERLGPGGAGRPTAAPRLVKPAPSYEAAKRIVAEGTEAERIALASRARGARRRSSISSPPTAS